MQTLNILAARSVIMALVMADTVLLFTWMIPTN